MKRSAALRRRARVKPRNAKRHTANWLRAYGSPERVQWVQAQHCACCGQTPSENAHTATGGTGRKADADTIVPLCHTHHRLLHQHGPARLEAEFGIHLASAAINTAAAWRAHERAVAENGETP